MTRGHFPLLLSLMLACVVGAQRLSANEEAPSSEGVGLSVEPGGLLIQHVEPGKTYDLAQQAGISLKISNQDTRQRTFALSAHQPSTVGNQKWLEGYEEIPDVGLFWFGQHEVTVEPQSDAQVKMYLTIPEGPRYYNQHWVVSIGVQGKAKPGELLALGAFPRYQIETESNAEIDEIPAGDPGLKPSVPVLEGMSLGATHRTQVKVYNNSEAKRRYTLKVRTIPVEETREQIVPSAGYAWIPDVAWVTPGKRHVTIEGHASLAVEVTVKVPNQPQYRGQRWEALLWIEPDEGRPRFARVQIQTEEAQRHP